MQFRTKARAVDLLGKGQIADLPTAITELWKNGYDAYADELKAKIYLKGYKGLTESLFVISDDGKGMSKKELYEKWLVLGTDSKTRAIPEKKPSEETLWKAPRIKAGEKGIGRLSVAFLGSPMLMVTKKLGHPAQALFFDWRVLENYNLFLDDIVIPVEEVGKKKDFNELLSVLKSDFLKNLDQRYIDDKLVWEKSQIDLRNDIKRAVQKVDLPLHVIVDNVSDVFDSVEKHGTYFFIFEPIEQLVALTEKDTDLLEDQGFVRTSLAGFTNDFRENRKLVTTEMPIYSSKSNVFDLLISKGEFWSYQDYGLADVIIDGNFDGNGSFQGTLTIYNEVIPYSYTNPRKKDKRSNYGSFYMKLGYSQGNEADSKLEGNVYERFKKKVDDYGGLYLYRDGFRILPYGRTEYDFLDFEKRRSKRAGTAYFSYRRMFGFIDITRANNPNLKDKSSREGLINNAAYRAFKNDLIALFVDLAAEYFSDKAKKSIFLDKKQELNDHDLVIRKDKEREVLAKKAFSRSLKEYPQKLKKYKEQYSFLVIQLGKKAKQADLLYSDIEHILEQLQTLDINYRNLLPKVPKRYEPTETQLSRLARYEEQIVEFHETTKREREELRELVKDKLEIQELKKEFIKSHRKFSGSLENKVFDMQIELEERFNELKNEFSERAGRIVSDLNFEKETLIDSIQSKVQVQDAADKVRSKYEFLIDQIERELSPLIEHLKRLSFDIDEELLQGAYRAEYENIKRHWGQTRETAQLGVAVEIIDHEFNHLYSSINYSLAKISKDSLFSESEQFKILRKNFQQLEEKYALLSPLYRISGVHRKEIACSDIYQYLQAFFLNRISQENIDFEATKSFLNNTIEIKEPVIYTVFINIINNAIYWLRNTEKKKIVLDYWKETGELLILNSGQRIEDHRLQRIFDLFYSNRPNGRGIGLYLAKESLNENYFDIIATNDNRYNYLDGACFIIKPNN